MRLEEENKARRDQAAELTEKLKVASASWPRVTFIQWADESRRPQGQKSPLPAKAAKAPSGKS